MRRHERSLSLHPSHCALTPVRALVRSLFACSAQKLISFGEISSKNIEQVRKLNLAVFPVKYNEKFYNDLANNPIQLYSHLGFFSDILVGAICSRIEPQEGSSFKIYVMTIGVLAPYRRLGIGERSRCA